MNMGRWIGPTPARLFIVIADFRREQLAVDVLASERRLVGYNTGVKIQTKRWDAVRGMMGVKFKGDSKQIPL
jgi:hypothetical protein